MNEGENRYPISLFSWQIKEKCGMVRTPAEGRGGSPLALEAVVSTAPSWQFLALQMLIGMGGCGGGVRG